MESIGARVWLVAYEVARGGPRGGRSLGYAITGGLLADLQLRGRLAADSEWCRLVDPTPLGCPALDDVLARVAEEPARLRSWLGWVRGYAREAPGAAVEELEEHGRLVRYERRVLRLLALPRHSLADPTRADRLRAAILETLTAPPGTGCEPRLATLTALVTSTGLGPPMAAADRLATARRMTEIDGLLPPGVRAVLAAVRAAQLDVAAPAGVVAG